MASLTTYYQKRDFKRTAEPRGRVVRTGKQRFVVQEHHASHLHYDFRLEIGGVLKSWAVPKGPTLDPKAKRLAVAVEDHPVDYLEFEGEIPPDSYGAGDVSIWDIGEFEFVDKSNPIRQLEDGQIRFRLHGKKLSGEFTLVRMGQDGKNWLLIKKNDEFARPDWRLEPVVAAKGGEKAGAGRGIRRQRGRDSRDEIAAVPSAEEEIPHLPGSPETMPRDISPMLATLVDEPFDDEDWLFEFKWDGIRTLCYLVNGNATFISRNGKDVGFRYPELSAVSESVNGKSAILDGEIVALNEKGLPDFQLLQSRIGLNSAEEIENRVSRVKIAYSIFDILYYDGYNLMPTPLAQRKELLERVLKPNDVFRYSSHVRGEGRKFFEKARRIGLEGVMAKHLDSPYVQTRSNKWLKIKAHLRQEVVIGGYTAPRKSRKFFGALVVGLYEDGRFRYVGHVGGGFNSTNLQALFERMQALKTGTCPFVNEPKTNEPVQWIKPELVCEVKFANWTEDDRLRQPIYVGLRVDKPPEQCRLERAMKVRPEVKRAEKSQALRTRVTAHKEILPLEEVLGQKDLGGDAAVKVDRFVVELTSLDKVLWPDEGYTKADLIRYYNFIAPYILPYLKDRPVILKRYPNGINKPFFYQHDVDHVPEYVKTYTTLSEEGRTVDYVVCNNRATLLYLANLGTIAQNPWHSRVTKPDNPDWIVFDLDPEKADWRAVCDMALHLRDALDGLGLRSYPKTSGASGLHVLVPVRAGYSFEQAQDFAEIVSRVVTKERPDKATVERAVKKRKSGLVYMDYLQNGKAKSVVSPYSVRETAGATVSTPLTWREVEEGIDKSAFTMQSMPARMKEKGDIFKPVLGGRQSLDKAIATLKKRIGS